MADWPPIVAVAFVSPVPAMVTVLPPDQGPIAGETREAGLASAQPDPPGPGANRFVVEAVAELAAVVAAPAHNGARGEQGAGVGRRPRRCRSCQQGHPCRRGSRRMTTGRVAVRGRAVAEFAAVVATRAGGCAVIERAQVCAPPASIAVTPARNPELSGLRTTTGRDRFVVVPSPSAPGQFWPQQTAAVASSRRAREAADRGDRRHASEGSGVLGVAHGGREPMARERPVAQHAAISSCPSRRRYRRRAGAQVCMLPTWRSADMPVRAPVSSEFSPRPGASEAWSCRHRASRTRYQPQHKAVPSSSRAQVWV